MFNDQQMQKYLKRINYQGELTVCRETLDALIYAHQCGIPFENLDVYDFHKDISLDEQSIYEKIVERNRGGYCFEVNGLFYAVLQTLGFDVSPCLCRVMFGLRDPRENLIDHRASIVRLDGARYFCEAGIGGAMPPGALQLPPDPEAEDDAGCPDIRTDAVPEGAWQEMHGEFFSVRTIERHWYGTVRLVDLGQDIYDDPMDRRERLEVMFCDAAAHDMDFIAPNYFLSRSDQSMFRRKRVVNLRTPDGYRALTDCIYREVSGGIRSEREVSFPEIPGLLRDKFGIIVEEWV